MTTQATWGGYYTAALENLKRPAQAQPVLQAAASASVEADYTNPHIIAQVTERFAALSLEDRARLGAEVTARGIAGKALEVTAFLHERLIGNDTMVATPTSASQALAVDAVELQQKNGLTTTNPVDMALMQTRVELRVKELLNQKEDPKHIPELIGQQFGATPELRALAVNMAEKQVAPQDFNLFNASAMARDAQQLDWERLKERASRPQSGPIPAVGLALASVDMGASVGSFLDHIQHAGPGPVPDARTNVPARANDGWTLT